MVAPNDEPMVLCAEGITHEMILEELTVPRFSLLLDNALLHAFDERSEKGLTHAGRERVRRPLSQRRVGVLTEGSFLPWLGWLVEQWHKTMPFNVVRNRHRC